MLHKTLAIFTLALLSACDSPSMAFQGTPGTRVEIGGSTFSVHRREDRVEVYRVSVEMLPNRAEVLAKAELAIEQATGCKVWKGTLKGDQALIKARLACNGEAPAPALPTSLSYECDVIDSWDIVSRDVSVDAIVCDLVSL